MSRRDKQTVIPLSEPCLKGNEWKYVRSCLDSGWISSSGEYVNKFEKTVAEYLGVKYAVATMNGTSALHTALMTAAIQPDEEVLVSSLSFIAPANAIRYIGAWPIFIDAEPQYWQMDPEKVIAFLEGKCQWANGTLLNRETRRKVKAILPVHILGHPCDMDEILRVARKYNLLVIEDASQSLGSKYKSEMVSSLGDIGCLSFNGNKIITTGGGGMIVTNNEAWAERARYLTTQAKDATNEYIHSQIGYNYRLTNIQAALGCAQMEQLKEFIMAKRSIASRYNSLLLHAEGISTMTEAPWAFSTFWLYSVLVRSEYSSSNGQLIVAKLKEANIQCRRLWQPLHLSPAFSDCQQFYCTNAEGLYEKCISLPSSVGIEKSEMEFVVRKLEQLVLNSNS